MSKIITFTKDGCPVGPSIRVADDEAADTYLRHRFGDGAGYPKMAGTVWFNGAGAARIMFDSAKQDVRRVLPKLEKGMVIWVDVEAQFIAMQNAVNSPRLQVVDA